MDTVLSVGHVGLSSSKTRVDVGTLVGSHGVRLKNLSRLPLLLPGSSGDNK